MNDVLLDDSLNPRLVHYAAVAASDLDPVGRLPKAALTAQIDAAICSWQTIDGTTVSKQLDVEYLEPVLGPQTLRIDVWIEELDRTSCVYGFTVSSQSGCTAFARGECTISTEEAWSAPVRARLAALLKNLPAYA